MKCDIAVGFVGLGKLGFPVALSIENHGFKVYATDPDPSGRIAKDIATRKLSYLEEGADNLLPRSRIQLSDLDSVVQNSDIIFVPVQTPHDKRFEGVSELPREGAILIIRSW
jgi:UDP-N-acetyl-D-mannosaminuronate dehydrogenase